MPNRRSILSWALSSVLVLTPAVAVTGIATETVAQERSLKVWFGRDQFIPEDQFAQFKADYPDINVEFEVIRLEDVNAQLVLAMRSGNAPDIVQIQQRDVSQLASGGVVKNFSHMIEEWKTRFPETYNQLAPLAWEGASDSNGNVMASHSLRSPSTSPTAPTGLTRPALLIHSRRRIRCSRRPRPCRRFQLAASGSVSA